MDSAQSEKQPAMEDVRSEPAAGDRAWRVMILPDYAEEQWPSMDLVAEMLADHLPAQLPTGSTVELHGPTFHRRASVALTRGRPGKYAWNLDRLANRLFDYPRECRTMRGAFDIYHVADHSYSQLVHALPAERAVVTCHDLDTFRCLIEPDHFPRNAAFRGMTRRILSGLQKAAHICCNSTATRDELCAYRLVPEDRCSVVRLGVRPELTTPSTREAVARIDELLGRPAADEAPLDILHVGSTIPRKRIDLLLEIFARVKRDVDARVRLVRVGGKFTAAQQAQADKLGLDEGSVRVLPFLSPAELAVVYRRAAIVLVPSEAEGFGLPVIEALAGGTPALASDLTALRETGGDAAEYAPVGNLEVWVERLSGLLKERRIDPAAWEARRERCRWQAGKFSWTEAARQTAEIYRQVLARAERAPMKRER
jgi:glycosyltransferase involved in cell wall biosynthesis